MTLKTFDLTGRIAVVSGAASGLGKAMSLGIAEAGADLVVVDRNETGLQDTCQQIEQLGRQAIAEVVDVSDPDQVASLFDRVDAHHGRVDYLGNVAGDGLLRRPEDITIDELKQVLQNLVVGRFAMCQQAGRRMLAAGHGSIVNIGSLASSTALGRHHIAYSMSMGAVIQMTRELSTEWSSRGVRVNAILPAQVTNDSLRERMQADPHLEQQFLSGIPIGRLGVPDDIKGLSVFLASDASSWITGALIPMDGGNMALNGGGTPGWMTAPEA